MEQLNCTILHAPDHLPRERIALSNMDYVMPPCYIQLLLFYENISSSLTHGKMQKALQLVMPHFPHLMGRLDKSTAADLFVLSNSGHVKLTSYYAANFSMSALRSVNFQQSFLPDDLLEALPRTSVEPLLTIQLTHSNDNGLVLGVNIHHHICDIHSAYQFLAALMSGINAAEAPSESPSSQLCFQQMKHNRDILRQRPATAHQVNEQQPCMFEHKEYTLRPKHQFPAEVTTRPLPPPACEVKLFTFQSHSPSCERIRQMCSTGVSLNDIACAVIWRAVCRARTLWPSPDETDAAAATGTTTSCLGMAVNARCRLGDYLTTHYHGNANFYCLTHSCEATLRLDGDAGLAGVTVAIREALQRTVQRDYLLDTVEFIAHNRGEFDIQPAFNTFFGTDLAVTSWGRTPFYTLSVLEKEENKLVPPSALRVPNKYFDGLVILLPSRSFHDTASWEAVIGLKAEHMHRLLTDSEFLRFFVPL